MKVLILGGLSCVTACHASINTNLGFVHHFHVYLIDYIMEIGWNLHYLFNLGLIFLII
jgi:hypothetical protein